MFQEEGWNDHHFVDDYQWKKHFHSRRYLCFIFYVFLVGITIYAKEKKREERERET
jgi:hypothetical protein